MGFRAAQHVCFSRCVLRLGPSEDVADRNQVDVALQHHRVRHVLLRDRAQRDALNFTAPAAREQAIAHLQRQRGQQLALVTDWKHVVAGHAQVLGGRPGGVILVHRRFLRRAQDEGRVVLGIDPHANVHVWLRGWAAVHDHHQKPKI